MSARCSAAGTASTSTAIVLVCWLHELGLRRVEEEAAGRVPGLRAHGRGQLRGEGAVAGRLRSGRPSASSSSAARCRAYANCSVIIAECPSFAPGGMPVGHSFAQSTKLHHGMGPRRPVSSTLALVPAEHAAHAGQEGADVGGIVPVHPVVVHHRDPEQREGRDVLAQVRRVAAGGDALRDARDVEVRDGLAHQPVVARHVERDQGLDAGVADVLELLVVGRVEVGLPGAQARHPPVHLPHVLDPGQVAREAGLLLERIAVKIPWRSWMRSGSSAVSTSSCT